MKRVLFSLFLLSLLPLAVQAQADKKLIEKAQNGDPAAMVRLGECYELGAGVAHDSTVAVQWFQKAADLGDGEGWIRLSKYYLSGTILPKDTARYFAIRKEWASKDLPNGIAAFGIAYENGFGVKEDTERAMDLYQLAVKNGSSWGYSRMGQILYHGTYGVAKDEQKALEYFQKAYKNGNLSSADDIARFYAFGKHHDYKNAWEWTLEGMKWNEPYAIATAAQMYFYGMGTDTNEAKALELVERLIVENHNLPFVQGLAGNLFISATSSELRDTAKGVRIWMDGDRLGFSNCQCFLGYYYIGIGQNEVGYNYLRKAAKNNDNPYYQGEACLAAGKCCYQGIGCEENTDKAIEWFLLGVDKFNSPECALALADIYVTDEYRDIPQAVKYYRKADKYGDTTALVQLGGLYADNGNNEQAMECYREMIGKGLIDGYYFLGISYANIGEEKECIKTLETGDKKGSILCSYALGTIYENGLCGKPVMAPNAITYYHKAGTPAAMYREGLLLANNGRGNKTADRVAADEARGMELIQQAADEGLIDALYTLGYCYETGTHVDSINHCKAIECFQTLADNEIAAGQFKMGLYYETGGCNLVPDSVKAIQYYQMAAAQGHGEAMCYLGDFHRIGRYLPLNKEKAFEYYMQAHQVEEETGTYYVGRSYLEGCGVDIDTAKAIPYLRAAAEQGVGNASYRLATFFNYGIGTLPQDADSALAYYIQGHENGSGDASYFIGHQLINEEAYESAVEYLYTAAQRGNIDGMVEFALCLQQGIGIEADPASAYKIWENVTHSANDSRAYCQLGIACLQGNGCPEDQTLGKAYLDTAANLGSVLAMRNLGICYENGYGCRPDTAMAITWLEKAADNEDIRAINALGDLYEEQGDFKNAALYYEKAVAAGSLEGYCNLGYCYESGQGVILNSQKAYELYMVAAEHGYSRGYRCVANCYFNGIHVEESMAEGFKWMKQAAEAGDVLAMYYCGALLEEGGEGLPADAKKAREWYKKAAAAGYEPAAAALSRMK